MPHSGFLHVTLHFANEPAAEQALLNAGFSIGRKQRGAPRGVLFGQYDIQKWRNLGLSHRQSLDGIVERMEDDSVRVSIRSATPHREAFRKLL